MYTSRTFQSYFDPTNTSGGTTIPSPLLAFIPPVGIGPFATSNSVTTPLGAQPIPFSLTNQTVFTSPAGGVGTPRDQFNGATVVVAVPEPATALLAGLAL